MKTIEIISTNISVRKGTVKQPSDSVFIDNEGIKGDAHAGNWHRQVSLLGIESIEKFEKILGRKIRFGEFAENFTTKGFDLFTLKPGDLIVNDMVQLEVTQIGKHCHGDGCEIFRQVGKCVMPTEGIFCKVLKQGMVKPGDSFQIIIK